MHSASCYVKIDAMVNMLLLKVSLFFTDYILYVLSTGVMEGGEDQNNNTTTTTNGNTQTGGNSRPPQIAHMSLYERQAVQVCV